MFGDEAFLPHVFVQVLAILGEIALAFSRAENELVIFAQGQYFRQGTLL